MMGVCNTPWCRICIHEGNKFWFYSLCISIFEGLWDLYHILATETTTTISSKSNSPHGNSAPAPKTDDGIQIIQEEEKRRNEGEVDKNKKRTSKTKTKIILKIIENTADLWLPGAVTGWIESDVGVVGCATVVSTVLSSGDIWRRVGNGEELRKR